MAASSFLAVFSPYISMSSGLLFVEFIQVYGIGDKPTVDEVLNDLRTETLDIHASFFEAKWMMRLTVLAGQESFVQYRSTDPFTDAIGSPQTGQT